MKRDGDEVRAEGRGRNIDIDGVNLAVRVFPELSRAVKELASWRSRRRKARGESVPGGEQRGHAHYVSRILCWFLRLSDEDQERIQCEGGALLEELASLGPDHKGGLPASFTQRSESVLLPGDRPRGAGGAGPPKQPRRHHARGLTAQLHPRKDGGQGTDHAIHDDHTPGGRARFG